MEITKRSLLRGFALLLSLSLIAGCGAPKMSEEGRKIYADKASWAAYESDAEHEVDVFWISAAVDKGTNGNFNMSLDDEKGKSHTVGALNQQRGIFDAVCNVFAPQYRQVSFLGYAEEDRTQYEDIAYADVRDAFLYYMENENNNRPFMLFGFSQGAQMGLRLMEELFGDKKYSDKLICAYLIGTAITTSDISAYPHLKMAQSDSDCGVIISYSSEAPFVTTSYVVPENTLGINPLSWSTDSALADASLNVGACMVGYDGAITKEIPAFCGAYLDSERGTLKIPDINPDDYRSKIELFGRGVYHLNDVSFFYRNLEANVKLRIKSFLQK